MRPVTYLQQLVTVFLVSVAAAAQSPWGFPISQRFVAVSLNGQSYGQKAPTVTVTQDAERNVLTAGGFAGCNTWFGRITLGQKQFGVGDLGTTKMFCGDRMDREIGFLDALKSVKRWRMDGPLLVLEGEQMTLLLSPALPNKP